MNTIFRRTAEGASVGGMIGAAIGALTASTATIMTGGLAAPLMFAMAIGTATAGGATSGAIGTLIGGGMGAIDGMIETVRSERYTEE